MNLGHPPGEALIIFTPSARSAPAHMWPLWCFSGVLTQWPTGFTRARWRRERQTLPQGRSLRMGALAVVSLHGLGGDGLAVVECEGAQRLHNPGIGAFMAFITCQSQRSSAPPFASPVRAPAPFLTGANRAPRQSGRPRCVRAARWSMSMATCRSIAAGRMHDRIWVRRGAHGHFGRVSKQRENNRRSS